jgi:hypothetical protein
LIETPTFIAQNITLDTDGTLVLIATVANVAEWIDPCKQSCSDGIIIIKITDINTKTTDIIFDDVIDSREGWKTIALNISRYKDKSIIFSIEGHAGGPCGAWCGEWLAVDKFLIGKLS